MVHFIITDTLVEKIASIQNMEVSDDCTVDSDKKGQVIHPRLRTYLAERFGGDPIECAKIYLRKKRKREWIEKNANLIFIGTILITGISFFFDFNKSEILPLALVVVGVPAITLYLLITNDRGNKELGVVYKFVSWKFHASTQGFCRDQNDLLEKDPETLKRDARIFILDHAERVARHERDCPPDSKSMEWMFADSKFCSTFDSFKEAELISESEESLRAAGVRQCKKHSDRT